MKPFLKFGISVIVAMALALQTGSAFALEPHVKGMTRTVDDDGADCPGAGYSRIGDALAVSGPGDTVIVCSGYYVEQLVISSKSGFRLIGKGSPEIRVGISSGALILVENSLDVTIQGLVLTGAFSSLSTEMTGISFWNSSGTISNNLIIGIRRANLDPSSFPQGVGIRVYGRDLSADTPAAVKILNNTITDVQYAGIWVESPTPPLAYTRHPGGYVPTISGNLIQTLATSNSIDFTSGIRLDWVAEGSVSKNVIVANSGLNGLGSLGYGIYLYNPSRIKITTNTVKAFRFGVYVNTYAAYLVEANIISKNQIIDGELTGIFFGEGQGGTQIRNNAIQGNKVIMKIPLGDKGMVFTASEDDDRVSGNKLTGNTIQGYNHPITINGDDGVSVSGNKISPFSTPGT